MILHLCPAPRLLLGSTSRFHEEVSHFNLETNDYLRRVILYLILSTYSSLRPYKKSTRGPIMCNRCVKFLSEFHATLATLPTPSPLLHWAYTDMALNRQLSSEHTLRMQWPGHTSCQPLTSSPADLSLSPGLPPLPGVPGVVLGWSTGPLPPTTTLLYPRPASPLHQYKQLQPIMKSYNHKHQHTHEGRKSQINEEGRKCQELPNLF